jgi:hypothetical protein
MNKIDFVNSLIDEQKKVVKNIEDSASRYRIASDLDENDSVDPEDLSHQEEAKEMQLRYEQMAILSKTNLKHLTEYKNKNCTTIEGGAMIETKEFYLYIGISLPQFELNSKTVITVSEQAPIYDLIKDKSVGDTITIGSTKSTILAIS